MTKHPVINNIKEKLWPNSLKKRMMILLLVVNFISVGLICFFSYYYLYTVQVRKMNTDLMDTVTAEQLNIEKLLYDMSSVSQMLDVNGGLGREVVDFYMEKDRYQQAYLFKNVNKQLVNIYLTNPNLGAVFYYFPHHPQMVQFSNYRASDQFTPDSLPLLYSANLLTFYGPHPSMNPLDHNMVFSLLRKMEDDDGNPFYIYLESKLGKNMEYLFSDQHMGINIAHSIINSQGETKYSNIDQVLPENASASIFRDKAALRSFTAQSDAGWKIMISVRQSDYAKEIMKWLIQFLSIASGSLLFSIFMAWMIWRLVNRPLGQMDKIVNHFIDNMPEMPATEFELIEFQNLYNTFKAAQIRIIDLISEVEIKEKQQSQLEVEKLLAQINPHFIHNTLNTIQWLARAQGNNDIVKLVTIFTRVLHYNMGKKSIIVTVAEEISAIRDYMELQSIRYDYLFHYQISMEPGTEHIPLPRFVLQPLVENALFHGVENSKGRIEIQVSKLENDTILFTVSDDGKGIAPEQLEKIREQSDAYERSSLGIGLNYVRKTLGTYYGSAAKLEIISKLNMGTRISIILPASGLIGIE